MMTKACLEKDCFEDIIALFFPLTKIFIISYFKSKRTLMFKVIKLDNIRNECNVADKYFNNKLDQSLK